MRPKPFSRNEEGAITVDFLVLTATMVTIALSLVNLVGGGLLGTAGKTGTYLANSENFDVSAGSASGMAAGGGGSGVDSAGSDTGEDDQPPEGSGETGDDSEGADDLLQIIENPEEETETSEDDASSEGSGRSDRGESVGRGQTIAPGRNRVSD